MTPVAMPRRGVSQTRTGAMQIGINAMSGFGARIAMMVIGFIVTPIVVNALGLAQFGLVSIVGSIAGYLGLLDFGLGGAFVKFISEHVTRGELHGARQVVTFGVLFYLLFGLVLAAPVYLVAPFLVHLFHMPADQYAAAVRYFRIVYVLVICSMAFSLAGSVVVGMHRMDIASRNNFIGYLVSSGVTIAFLKVGYGVNAMLCGMTAQLVVTATLQYVSARRLLGSLWHDPRTFEWSMLRRLAGFGGWTQANSLLNIFNLDVGRFIAASAINIASLGVYEIGSKISFLTKSLPNYLLDALMPAASAADAAGDGLRLHAIYVRATRYSTGLSLLFAGFIVGAADEIVHVWIGRSLPFVAAILLWLTLGYAVNSTTGVGTTILRAKGLPRFETYYTAVASAVTVIATIVLLPRFGIVGVAAGSACGWFGGSVYFFVVYHRYDRIPWWTSVGFPTVRLFAAAALASAAVWRLVRVPAIAHLFDTRIIGMLALASVGVCYAAAFVALSWLFGAWNEDVPIVIRRLRLAWGLST